MPVWHFPLLLLIVPLQLALQFGITIDLILGKVCLLNFDGPLANPLIHMVDEMVQPVINSVVDHFDKELFFVMVLGIFANEFNRLEVDLENVLIGQVNLVTDFREERLVVEQAS